MSNACFFVCKWCGVSQYHQWDNLYRFQGALYYCNSHNYWLRSATVIYSSTRVNNCANLSERSLNCSCVYILEASFCTCGFQKLEMLTFRTRYVARLFLCTYGFQNVRLKSFKGSYIYIYVYIYIYNIGIWEGLRHSSRRVICLLLCPLEKLHNRSKSYCSTFLPLTRTGAYVSINLPVVQNTSLHVAKHLINQLHTAPSLTISMHPGIKYLTAEKERTRKRTFACEREDFCRVACHLFVVCAAHMHGHSQVKWSRNTWSSNLLKSKGDDQWINSIKRSCA